MKTILTLIAALAVGACAPLMLETTDCADAKRGQATVKYLKNSKIDVSPPNLEVIQGDVVVYKIVGDRSRKVEIVGDAASGWLDEEIAPNSGQGNIRFGYACVADEQDPNTPYTYKVVIDGVGELDPEVTVRRRNR